MHWVYFNSAKYMQIKKKTQHNSALWLPYFMLSLPNNKGSWQTSDILTYSSMVTNIQSNIQSDKVWIPRGTNTQYVKPSFTPYLTRLGELVTSLGLRHAEEQVNGLKTNVF